MSTLYFVKKNAQYYTWLKTLLKSVSIKKFFGLLAAPIFLLADYHIFHFAKVFLKTQNLPSSISLLMSHITNFYQIKHSEFIHGLKETCIVFIAEALHFTDKNPRHKDKFFNLILNFSIKHYISHFGVGLFAL